MRIVSCVLAIMFLFANVAMAENMGVMVINASKQNISADADDMQLHVPTEIEGFGIVTPTDMIISDTFGWYYQGATTVQSGWDNYDHAGEDAEYAILWFDIQNTGFVEKLYLENYDYNVSAAVVMDDAYRYTGWVGQLNYDNRTADYGPDAGRQNTRWVIHGDDHFPIIPMATGHYMCVCTIPNAVVKSDAPLKMVIRIGDVEMTYHIRK